MNISRLSCITSSLFSGTIKSDKKFSLRSSDSNLQINNQAQENDNFIMFISLIKQKTNVKNVVSAIGKFLKDDEKVKERRLTDGFNTDEEMSEKDVQVSMKKIQEEVEKKNKKMEKERLKEEKKKKEKEKEKEKEKKDEKSASVFSVTRINITSEDKSSYSSFFHSFIFL